MHLHVPEVYRYRVSRSARRLRPRLNRYGWQVIGAYVVVGDHVYCVKWGWAS